MSVSLKEKLQSEVCGAEWKILRPHYERKALFVAGQHLDLVEIAIDIAEDNVQRIKEVLESGELRQPTDDEAEMWKLNPDKIIGDFLIVSPYVILKSKLDE